MRAFNSLGQRIKHVLRVDRAVCFVWQAGPGWAVANLALVVIQGVLPLLTLYLMKLIVDAVALAISAPGQSSGFGHVGLLIALAGGVACASAVIKSLSTLVREAQTQAVTDHMYDVLHAKSIQVDLEYYENPQYHDTLHRAQQEGPYRPTYILNGLIQLVQSGVSLAAMAGLLFSFHWLLAVVLFATAVPGVAVRLRYSGRLYQWQRERTSAERKASYFNWLLTGDVHAKEVRQFDLGTLFRERFRELRRRLRHERLQITRQRSWGELLAETGGIAAVFGSLGFIAYRTVHGVITLGDMVMYFGAFQRGLGFLRDLLRAVADLYENSLFLANLYEFLDLELKVKECTHPRALPRPMETGIVFDRVMFRYPGSEKRVLQDITLAIKPGELVALVGENGSGKTTLVKLLCRLYDPSDGKIFLDGLDLRQFKIVDLRREMSVIFQDYVQYYLTARENIWLGNTDLPMADQRVASAARRAEADSLIEKLPKGYETILGKWFGDGEELSIGEWQKVALARAFLREGQFVVLDEPTSSLDSKTEYEIFQGFRRLLRGKTAILISHRFSTVRVADRILVMEDGRIGESGSHEELLQRGGKYAHLFEMQARHYR